jgi:hypothetical protein
VGLERELTHPFVWPSSTGVSVSAYDTIQLEKCTPLSNNEYIGVFGKNRGSGGMSRFANPGHFYYFNTGANGILDIRVHGGVYKITLREEPAYPGVSNGSVSFLCERVLPNPETTGRQWDYQVVGSDIYVLTETEGGNIHVYKNTTEILRITGAPTYARSFAIVGSHIYFGLGSEARDPWWNSGAETISEHCGRVLKAANVL